MSFEKMFHEFKSSGRKVVEISNPNPEFVQLLNDVKVDIENGDYEPILDGFADDSISNNKDGSPLPFKAFQTTNCQTPQIRSKIG